jgi:membrane protein DedA with SNARE-associated domain
VGTFLATLVLAATHAMHEAPRADYAGIALAAAISWAGLPGPGEAALIAAGIAASRGKLDLTAVLALAWAGATVGGTAGWLVGHHGGRRIVLAGQWFRQRRERALHHGSRFFDRYGILAVYFTPSWVAGLNAMSARRFLPANALSAVAWAVPIGLGAYLIGPSIADIATDFGLIGTAVVVILAVVVAVMGRRRLRHHEGPTP